MVVDFGGRGDVAHEGILAAGSLLAPRTVGSFGACSGHSRDAASPTSALSARWSD
jgi:hypothetical protein